MKCDWCPKHEEAEYVVVLGNLNGEIWDVRLCGMHMKVLNSCRKMITETKTAVPVVDHGYWRFADNWISQPL